MKNYYPILIVIILACAVYIYYLMSKLRGLENIEKEHFEDKKIIQKLSAQINQFKVKCQELEGLKLSSEVVHGKMRQLEKDRKEFEDKIVYEKKVLNQLVNEKKIGFPWLAKAYADYIHLKDMMLSDSLENKKNPAPKAAAEVRQIAREKKELKYISKNLKYQIDYYEALFPWLKEFHDIPDDLIVSDKNFSRTDAEGVDPVTKYLSPGEFSTLSNREKFQKALDRYWKSEKSRWEIGKQYERYVGYLFEGMNCRVEFHGIIKGFEDLGRDIVAFKNGEVFIVQCKCWSREKVIHEKHIFQLVGTTIDYIINKYERFSGNIFDVYGKIVKPVFYTTTSLSEIARRSAGLLNVSVYENFMLQRYPSIKCNVNKSSGDKIYHLPFDQQYDKIIIEKDKGECYIDTVDKAEDLGFRRAFKWRGV